MEYANADSLEVFVEDDALEGGVVAEHQPFDDFELIGESDTREGVTLLECCLSYICNIAVFTEYHAHQMVTFKESILRNALKIGQSGEVNSKEGRAPVEGMMLVPRNCSEVGAPQGELNGSIGEALMP